MASGSESDLSDAIDPPNATSISSNTSRRDDNGEDLVQSRNIESLPEEDAVGSDDGDFDMETPPLADADSPGDARSSSQDSRRNGKRKAGADHDDYMLENPELYGLRRSVSNGLRCPYPQCYNIFEQGRARPSRPIVSALILSALPSVTDSPID